MFYGYLAKAGNIVYVFITQDIWVKFGISMDDDLILILII